MNHSFNTKIAKDLDLPCAVIIENIAFWIRKNQSNKKHFYDGEYWTYNSAKAFTEMFEYFSKQQIERIIRKLIDKNIIKTGNYNKMAYDRTNWYTIIDVNIKKIYAIDSDESIYRNRGMETSKTMNGNIENDEPIPDINTNINTVIKKKEERFNFRKELINYGFKENVISDWLEVRKKRKSSNTQTAFKAFINKINKSKHNKDYILETVVEKSWVSFQEEWIDNIQPKTNIKKTQDQTFKDIWANMPSQQIGK